MKTQRHKYLGIRWSEKNGMVAWDQVHIPPTEKLKLDDLDFFRLAIRVENGFDPVWIEELIPKARWKQWLRGRAAIRPTELPDPAVLESCDRRIKEEHRKWMSRQQSERKMRANWKAIEAERAGHYRDADRLRRHALARLFAACGGIPEKEEPLIFYS